MPLTRSTPQLQSKPRVAPWSSSRPGQLKQQPIQRVLTFFSKLSSPKNDQHRVIQLTLQAAHSRGDGVPLERLINQTITMTPLGMK
jgi:hypothetical protein